MSRYGIPDESFIRGKIPMTKAEIRALTLNKLNIKDSDIIWDIGAGTGSISVETALNTPLGQVWAIEKNPEAVKLLKANKEKFSCQSLHIIEGSAPQIFNEIPKPTKAVIGGSGGNMQEILKYLWFNTGVEVIVINTITLNSTNQALEFLTKLAAKIDASQISVNNIKLVNGYYMLQSQNPIFIISARR
ncbi:MAG: hypothetical protein VR72_00880 [Clostridiaceae bacterium BRH_c20a]|nr:MAG: hypothetical protein VR72_00880 [Clostridiaceae bacterium BRH_c20a]